MLQGTLMGWQGSSDGSEYVKTLAFWQKITFGSLSVSRFLFIKWEALWCAPLWFQNLPGLLWHLALWGKSSCSELAQPPEPRALCAWEVWVICEHCRAGCKNLTFCRLSPHSCWLKSAPGAAGVPQEAEEDENFSSSFCTFQVSAAEFSFTQGHSKRSLLHFAVSLTDMVWELGLVQ